MTMNGINPAAPRALQSVERTEGKQTDKVTSEQKTEEVRQDQFVSADSGQSAVYTRPENKKVTANQLTEMQRQRTDSFTQMLRSMVTRQGQTSNLTLMGMNLTVTASDSAAAQAAIAPGGEHSVDAVSGRILDMAKALAGGDASKLDTLRTAVQKGFKAAGVDLGGKLPSICNDTYDQVMKGFDDWEKELAS